jgi:hypothetical protein
MSASSAPGTANYRQRNPHGLATMVQLALQFEPGLTARFPHLEDVFVAAVYGSRKGLNGVAGDLDMSPSDLSKRLSRDSAEQRPLRLGDAVAIVESTGDLRPVYWLVERFCQDPEVLKTQAIAQLAQLMPALNALLEQAGSPASPGLRAAK